MEQAAGTLVHGTAALAISSASTGAATRAAKEICLAQNALGGYRNRPLCPRKPSPSSSPPTECGQPQQWQDGPLARAP
jgi:hypothetical protein